MLEAAGLGYDRLLAEVDARLNAKVTKHYKDEELGDFEDNTTRTRATELLADILGVRKKEIKHTGEINIKGYIGVSPDDWDDEDNSAV